MKMNTKIKPIGAIADTEAAKNGDPLWVACFIVVDIYVQHS